MAKKKATTSTGSVDNAVSDTSTVSDRYIYYDKLHFIPVEDKNEVWGAQVLNFIKRNAVWFTDPVKLKKFREIDRGEINVAEYKNMIDPLEPNTDGQRLDTPAQAAFFNADWKSCPIFAHLDNILEAKVEQIPINLVVTASDQFAMSKKQKANAQIIGTGVMRNFLNEFNAKLGYPPLGKMDDPFKYVQQIQAGYQPPQKSKKFKLQNQNNGQAPTSLLDSLKSAINDDESLALYNDYIYKDGAEIACEIGLKYYMLQVNKYKTKTRNIVADLKNAGGALLRFYTSQTTGRPILEYKDCLKIRTLPFVERDLSDLKGWYEEDEITFGQFVQEFGANRTKEELKQIFEAHRKFNNFKSSVTYENCDYYTRTNAKILRGYCEFETQDMEVYSNYIPPVGNPIYKREKSDYVPENSYTTRDEKHYNCWYKFYYMPLLLDSLTPNYNLVMQANYIYDFGKLQDQQRDGVDYQLVKGSLVGCRDTKKMTWAEIMNRIMPKINFLWFRFQNEMVNAIPNGGFFAKELVAMMAQAADEAGNDNLTAQIAFMKRFKQTGWGVAATKKDPDGKIIGDGSPFTEFKNTMMEGAFQNLTGMMQLYNFLMQSLSQNAITEGAGSKPRQNATGIEASITASDQAIYYITAPFEQLTEDAATKFLYYFKAIVDEGDSGRLQEFMDIVGEANAEAFQAVQDIPYHNLGLSVENVMTDDQKQLVTQLCENLASAGILMPEDVFFIASIDNVKYAYAILCLKAKAGRQALADQQQAQFQQTMQLKQVDLKIQQTLIQTQQQANAQNINITKQWDYKIDAMIDGLKGQIQGILKDKVGKNKTDEIVTESNVNKINGQPDQGHPKDFGLTTA